jgi:putative cell wall-binding protein
VAPSLTRNLTRIAATGAVAAIIGALAPSAVARAAVTTASGVPITRFSGVTRYATAAEIATTAFTTAPSVVIASGASFADALSGNYLAGEVDGPILLTDPNTLSPETIAALGTLQTRTVLLLGGESAVSNNVATTIASLTSTSPAGGKLTVTRIAGASRYDTDKAVVEKAPASYVSRIGGKSTALLASGLTFPDALAAGALAFGAALPILLTDPSTLSPQAAAAIRDLNIQQVLILGGGAAVSPAVESAVDAMSVTTLRLAGMTRTGTAAAIASYAGSTLGWGSTPTQLPAGFPADAVFTHLDIARGDDAGGGVDALALGPLAGHTQTPIMLTASVDDPSSDLYYEVDESAFRAPAPPGPLVGINIAGGTSAVSAANAELISVASGGGQSGAMSVAPTSMTAGTQVTATSTDPCPPAPAGTAGFVSVFLSPTTGTGARADVATGPLPLSGGAFKVQGAVPAGLAAGQYQTAAACGVTFSGDAFFYPYAVDLGPTVTVS